MSLVDKTSFNRASEGTVIENDSVSALETRELAIADIMTTDLAAIPPWISLAAARKIAALKGAEHMLVEDEGRLVGVVSGADLVAAPDEDTVGAWTTRARISVTPTTSAVRARHLMEKNRLPCLPVLAGTWLIGLVTRAAVERALARDARSRQASLTARHAAATTPGEARV